MTTSRLATSSSWKTPTGLIVARRRPTVFQIYPSLSALLCTGWISAWTVDATDQLASIRHDSKLPPAESMLVIAPTMMRIPDPICRSICAPRALAMLCSKVT